MQTEITMATTGTATLRLDDVTVVLDAKTVEALRRAREALEETSRAQVQRGGRMMVVPRG